MFLIVIGAHRNQLSPLQSWHSYRRRFELEHTFRFEKQNLLLNDFQTPELEHEENWVTLVMLAYVQLWVAHSFPGPGNAIDPLLHPGVSVPQKSSATGIELFASWVPRQLRPNSEVNPLGGKRDKLRPLGLDPK